MLRNIKSKVFELLFISILDFVKARDDLEAAQKEHNYYRQVLIKADLMEQVTVNNIFILCSQPVIPLNITAHYCFNYVQ